MSESDLADPPRARAGPAVRRRGVGLSTTDAAASTRRCKSIALERSRPRRVPQPDRGHLGRADARRLFLGRHAADVFALVVRQALRARRDALSQGLSGARLRDRHQLQSLHQLLHGREHHGDADAGAGARGVRPQSFLQEQLSVPAMDRSRTASSTISNSPSAMSPNARRGTAPEAVESVLDAAHALHEPGRVPLSPRHQAEARGIRARGGASGSRTRRATYSDLWRTVPSLAARQGADAERTGGGRAQAAGCACRKRTCSISWRRTARSCSPGSASCCASCATSRNISIRSARPS